MLSFSSDPKVAERQMDTLIFALTAFGYIDGDFDASEKDLVKKTILELVEHRVDTGMPDATPEVRRDVVERFGQHFVEKFEQIDSQVNDFFLEPVANEVLDGMMAVIEARRGFMGLVTDPATGRWAFHVARHLTHEDITDPEKHVSRGVIEQVLTSGEPVVTFDAEGGEFSSRSVTRLRLRSIACVPLWNRDRLVGQYCAGEQK